MERCENSLSVPLNVIILPVETWNNSSWPGGNEMSL